MVKLINEGRSKVRVVKCRADSGRVRLDLTVDGHPFFAPGTRVIVYQNGEAPVFIGFSARIFPDLADLLSELDANSAKKLLKEWMEAHGKLATMVWLMELMRRDEKLQALIESLKALNDQIRKLRREKAKIKAVDKMLESLG